jgi:hypothetical protein
MNKETRLDLESMFKIIDPSPFPFHDWKSKMLSPLVPISSIALFTLLLIAQMNDDGRVVGLLLGAKLVFLIKVCKSWEPALL